MKPSQLELFEEGKQSPPADIIQALLHRVCEALEKEPLGELKAECQLYFAALKATSETARGGSRSRVFRDAQSKLEKEYEP